VNLNLTLLGQMISFAIFVWFCMKYVWPPIMSALEERQSKIAQGLAEAAEIVAQAKLLLRRKSVAMKSSKNRKPAHVLKAIDSSRRLRLKLNRKLFKLVNLCDSKLVTSR